MRATLVVLVLAALVVAALPLAHRADAREGELAAPRLRERAEDGARLIEWEGRSALSVTGICLPAQRACLGSNETQDGRFFLPAAASDGRVVVTWSAVNDSLRELRVNVGPFSAIGGSPLVVAVPAGAAGEYAVHAEPNRTVAGAWEQPLSWTATFLVGAPPARVTTSGAAGYATSTGCAILLCDTTLRQHGDALVVPWTAAGQLVVEWDPIAGPLRVGIAGTSFFAEGEPPLTIPVDGLAAGEWALDVRPEIALPLERVEVRWSADLVERQQTSS